MKKLLIAFLLLPSIAHAQTQHDRIDARGQVKTDKFINRATIIITGATPDVSNGNVFKTNNPGSVTVTNLLGGSDTQVITINCGDANTTFQNNANLVNASGTDFICGVNKTISYMRDAAQGKWVQSGAGSGGGGGGSPGTPNNSVQVNRTGTFTGGSATDDGTTFAINADSQLKGPNPNFDLRAFGGYNGTDVGTTGSITSGTATLTLAAARDFANGQGVVVYKAGAATALTTPGQATVTPINLLNGATTYNYQVIAEDRTGGLTAASTVGTTSTGIASLGPNTITLTNCVITSGIATYTSSGNHNLAVAARLDIEGFTGTFASPCNGVVMVATTPSGTTFTVNKGTGAPNQTVSTGSPTATVFACNKLTYPLASFSGGNTLRYWIYRNSSVVGVAPGVDPFFIDCGRPITGIPAYVPATPPGSTTPGYLATTIVSGAGSTTLTLAANAGTTAASQSVLHDNSPNMKAAVQAAYNAGGGTVYLPNSAAFAFNSAIDFTTVTGAFSSAVRIHFNNSSSINQTWIPHSSMDFDGEPRQGTSFQYVNGALVTGTAHPMFLIPEFSNTVHFNRIFLQSAAQQQTLVLLDSTDGGSSAGNTFDDVALNGLNGDGRPLVTKGGFDFYWKRGVCNSGATSFKVGSCITHTIASGAVALVGQILGRTQLDNVNFAGSSIEYDCRPSLANNISIRDGRYFGSLLESSIGPYIQFTGCGSQRISNMQVKNLNISDNIVACATPIVEATEGNLFDIAFEGMLSFCGAPPLAIVNTGGFSFMQYSGTGGSSNSGNISTVTTLSPEGLGGLLVGRAITPLTVLGAPSLALSAGGSIAVGSFCYQIVAIDIDGIESLPGPCANITTTGGNQTVTVTPPTLPSGSTSYRPYRSQTNIGGSPARANIQAFGSCAFAVIPAGVQFVDSFSFTCGQAAPILSSAGASVLGASGMSTPAFRLMTNGFTTSILGDSTANETATLPHASGTLCLTAACVVNAITINGDGALSANPRSTPPIFFPGALTTTWTAASWTLDKAITVTRVQSAAKVSPSGCGTSAIVRVTDGLTPINLTINSGTNDSGVISQNYAAGATLTVSIQTAAATCTTAPGDLNVSIQSRMQ